MKFGTASPRDKPINSPFFDKFLEGRLNLKGIPELEAPETVSPVENYACLEEDPSFGGCGDLRVFMRSVTSIYPEFTSRIASDPSQEMDVFFFFYRDLNTFMKNINIENVSQIIEIYPDKCELIKTRNMNIKNFIISDFDSRKMRRSCIISGTLCIWTKNCGFRSDLEFFDLYSIAVLRAGLRKDHAIKLLRELHSRWGRN